MSFTAIMAADLDNRISKRADFLLESDAFAHVAEQIIRWPDAFVVSTPVEPESHWLLDMALKTVTILEPPPPDFDAIDQATVDRLLLESGVMRAFGLMMFEIGKAGKTGNWSFFDGVTNLETFKARFKSLIR
jgi:hypothetical protein